MNFFARGRMLKGLYEHNKELQSALEHMEEELNLQIEKLQDENEYLKDELAYSRVRSNRLDEEIKTVRERDFKDIYPGLQAEVEELNKRLGEAQEARATYVKAMATYICKNCEEDCDSDRDSCEPQDTFSKHLATFLKIRDEVPTETTSEDS